MVFPSPNNINRDSKKHAFRIVFCCLWVEARAHDTCGIVPILILRRLLTIKVNYSATIIALGLINSLGVAVRF